MTSPEYKLWLDNEIRRMRSTRQTRAVRELVVPFLIVGGLLLVVWLVLHRVWEVF